MQTIETIRTIRAGRFRVEVTAEEEPDIDLSFDVNGEVAKRLDDGELMAFCVAARCYLDGHELAADYLGSCIYETPRAFMDHMGLRAHNKATGHNCGSYFSDMVRNVCQEARKEVAELQRVRVRAVA